MSEDPKKLRQAVLNFKVSKLLSVKKSAREMASETSLRKRETKQREERMAEKLNETTQTEVLESIEATGSIRRIFGFGFSDLSSFPRFVKLLSRPMNPAGLGVMRLMFGLLMLVDVLYERGMVFIEERWRNPDDCHFPLFDFLRPLPLQWMCIVYLAMWIGAFGIMLGLFYRLSCLLFLVPYWYLFLLNKQRWNHHSYLFGLLAFMFLLMDGDRYWSLDGLRNSKLRNAQVPLWNYTLLRFQNFLVYFVAGLKKIDADWLGGHSLPLIGSHFVFSPMRYFLTEQQVTLYIVHHCGFVFDLTVGFLLFFDVTRPYALWFCAIFNLMNMQIFSIGMFPWMMIATMSIFCYPNWPRKLLRKTTRYLQFLSPVDSSLQPSNHCLYEKEAIKPEQVDLNSALQDGEQAKMQDKPSFYHKAAAIFTVCYILVQCFLPYSHFLTKGYNTWVNGLYGYSWDMMVNNLDSGHFKISYTSKQNKKLQYLKPTAFLKGHRTRWIAHPDMTKQYARCLSQKLSRFNITDVKLYFDIWLSLNWRFHQRIYNPNMDMVAADWSPFKATSWVLPLHGESSKWRMTAKSIMQSQRKSNRYVPTIFIVDFPGFKLENYIPKNYLVNLTVLKGSVVVTIGRSGKVVHLDEDGNVQLPNETYHTVHTVSNISAFYMYSYIYILEDEKMEDKYNKRDYTNTQIPGIISFLAETCIMLFKLLQYLLRAHLYGCYKSLKLGVGALYSFITNYPFDAIVNSTITYDEYSKHLVEGLFYFKEKT